MSTSLEDKFHEQAMAVYENGKRVLGYNATRFLQKVRSDGGVAAAKSWLRPKKPDRPTNGFLKLVDGGHLGLSLEALVLREPWKSLFTDDELLTARRRLTKYGFFEQQPEQRDRADLIPQQIDVVTYHEGSVQSVLVNRHERNAQARKACINHYGPRCYICDFDFAARYGSDLEGFIHVHHLCSLSAIGGDYEVDPIADLRPVCPNCHAVIHSQTPCLTIEKVRELIRSVGAV